MGLKILYNGQVTDFSDSKYDPQDYGSMRLNIRVGSGIKKYGLATSASQSSDKKVKFNVNGNVYYIGTSSALSRQSDYTSYQTYYTYTYTSGEPKSSVLTRQGTTTTATKTQPARYSYQASYYTGVTSGYTVRTSSRYYTQSLLLSSTRSAQRTDYYKESYTKYTMSKVSMTSVVVTTNRSFSVNNKSSYSRTGTAQSYSASTTVPPSTTNVGNIVQSVWVQTSTNLRDLYSLDKKGNRWDFEGKVSATTSGYNATRYYVISPVVVTYASNIYTSPPGYYAVQAWQGPYGTATGTYSVAAANYKNSDANAYQTGGHQANYSFWSRRNNYITDQYASVTGRHGNATLSSTATPIGGVPANYTLSAGPAVTKSQQSYTYTDAGCTKTYQSNYSTSYWTVTHTLTSNQPTQSSVGSTKLTRVSHYTEHNFV